MPREMIPRLICRGLMVLISVALAFAVGLALIGGDGRPRA